MLVEWEDTVPMQGLTGKLLPTGWNHLPKWDILFCTLNIYIPDFMNMQ